MTNVGRQRGGERCGGAIIGREPSSRIARSGILRAAEHRSARFVSPDKRIFARELAPIPGVD
jgi:hypothetical protein